MEFRSFSFFYVISMNYWESFLYLCGEEEDMELVGRGIDHGFSFEYESICISLHPARRKVAVLDFQ